MHVGQGVPLKWSEVSQFQSGARLPKADARLLDR